MPPKTRGTKTSKASKASKENACVVEKTKLKGITKAPKTRKALADKTNSASDDNTYTENPKSEAKKNVGKVIENEENAERPRRERRLPNRFVENQVLKNLSNSKEVTVNSDLNESKSPNKNDSTILSPFKTPQKDDDNSLITNRPKRVCRLPSKFDDHSISPIKFIPVSCHASTPILLNKAKPNIQANEKLTSLNVAKQSRPKRGVLRNKPIESPPKVIIEESPQKTIAKTVKPVSLNVANPSKAKRGVAKNKPHESPQKIIVDDSPQKISKTSPIKKTIVKPNADTNNNAKQKLLRTRALKNKQKSPEKLSPVKTASAKLLENSFSFRVLEDKKKSVKRDSSHLDVYEFTYDPNEEPPPQKKKRKKVVKKKPAKPKTVVFKNNYDQNVNKALAALKNVVSKKPSPPKENVQKVPQNTQLIQPQNTQKIKPQNAQKIKPKPVLASNTVAKDTNHVSVAIEDIAADIQPMESHHDINYSPVTSPNRGKSPMPSGDHSIERNYQDPLNLQECISFFDDPPVASSSMNVSTRRPQDTPWRVQFEQLPIKWPVNTYVKANMTPAVESSFINFDDSKKKHVYTNMVPDAPEELPEIVENNQSRYKQTSIISYIKEVVQRSASKKKRARSVTPTKANSIFEDLSNISVNTNKDAHVTPRKTPRREAPGNSTPNRSDENVINNDESPISEDKENTSSTKKSKKSKSRSKDKDGTFFGFDEIEDQENVSPVKIDNPRVRALRPRARAVLHEINALTGPSRAKLPLAAKTNIAASSDAVNKVYEELKSATDAPVFPEKDLAGVAMTEVEEPMEVQEDNDDDAASVHLFEDIEVVHHLQPTRKSYGKAGKKVAFQASNSDSESQINPLAMVESGDEDDLADLTFTLPNVQQKTKPKKKAKKKDNLSKKERAEMDAWAAGFNSMCEDIEEFPLVVE